MNVVQTNLPVKSICSLNAVVFNMKSHACENTVFLSPQEVENIQSTAKARLKTCSELVGQAREPRDAKTAISQATGASLMMDMGGVQSFHQSQDEGPNTLPVLIIGQPYPPSNKALQQLQLMKVSDLRTETHHYGCFLLVKRASPVVIQRATSWTMVTCGVCNEVERLELRLHKSKHGGDVLESAAQYAIKEPYFTFADRGEATIRIDHPSDLIASRYFLEHNLPVSNGSTKFIEETDSAEDNARRLKKEGDIAVQQNNIPAAYEAYTEALNFARQAAAPEKESPLFQEIHHHRAQVNLLLGQFDQAKVDAMASLTGRDVTQSQCSDSKAYHTAGRAAYSLGEFDQARAMFIEQLKIAPGNKAARAGLRNAEIRICEQETARYDWNKIKLSSSHIGASVDVGSSTISTEVKESPGKGRGLFATCNIPKGQLILSEKAFCVSLGHDSRSLTAITYDVRDKRVRVSPVGLSAMVVEKVLCNVSQAQRVMDLYGGFECESECESMTMNDNGLVVDVFRIHNIISRNAFGLKSQHGENNRGNANTGLWIHASYLNHSCVPNSDKEFIGDMMVLRATQPITAGDEIFHSYTQPMDYDTRRSVLMDNWNFECKCALCVAEMRDDPITRKRRQELAAEADNFTQRVHWVDAKRLSIAKAQRYLQAIEKTYDKQRYANLPHLAAKRLEEWLRKARKNSQLG